MGSLRGSALRTAPASRAPTRCSRSIERSHVGRTGVVRAHHQQRAVGHLAQHRGVRHAVQRWRVHEHDVEAFGQVAEGGAQAGRGQQLARVGRVLAGRQHGQPAVQRVLQHARARSAVPASTSARPRLLSSGRYRPTPGVRMLASTRTTLAPVSAMAIASPQATAVVPSSGVRAGEQQRGAAGAVAPVGGDVRQQAAEPPERLGERLVRVAATAGAAAERDDADRAEAEPAQVVLVGHGLAGRLPHRHRGRADQQAEHRREAEVADQVAGLADGDRILRDR